MFLSATPVNSPNIYMTISSSYSFVGTPTTWSITGGGGQSPYTFNWIGGSLPTGMSFSGTKIIGTPTVAGTYSFTLSATDANGFGGNRTFKTSTFQLINPLPSATVAIAYSSAVVTGGNPPYA